MKLERFRGAAWWLALAWIGWLWVAAFGAVQAASPEEARAFEALEKLFQDRLYELVEREGTNFLTTFPGAERAGEVVLYGVQARLKLHRPAEALRLLSERAGMAGKWAEEFGFWRAEALLDQGDWVGAAGAFAAFLKAYPESARRLTAAYREAFARYRQGDVEQATRVLRDPDGVFAKAARGQPEDEAGIRGWLLLAQLLLERGDGAGAGQALALLSGKVVPGGLAAEREYLLARQAASRGDWTAALGHTTNFWAVATNGVTRELRSAGVLLQGEVLERLQQPGAAAQAYERALGDDVAPGTRRLALQRTIELSLREGKSVELGQRLEAFLKQHPQDDLLDLVQLTLGELKLKEYRTLRGGSPEVGGEGRGGATNLLGQARGQFEAVLTNHPQSQLLGRIHLDRGWTFWEEGTNRLAEGLSAFQAAVERLPVSADQAVARFKCGDCQLRMGDWLGAVSNYWQVATNYGTVPGVNGALAGQALFLIVQASLEAGDPNSAASAVRVLAQVDPGGQLADRAELLMGQVLSRMGRTVEARGVLEDCLRRFTNSTLLPEVRLTLARTYEDEQAWPVAIAGYGAWLGTYTNGAGAGSNLVAQAWFDLARASYRANPDTNALALLTNAVSRFPDNTNAVLVQYLVGEYYFVQNDYGKAELNFLSPVLAFTKDPALRETTYRARLMAGRAAVARQSYKSARDHFDAIITNGPLYSANLPMSDSVVAEAYLFRGDTFTLEPGGSETNGLARFEQAINAFTKITERFPTNEWAPVAWGRIGECHFQLASQDPKRYPAAIDALRKVVESGADISVRSQAEWKLGLVLQRQAAVRPEAERAGIEAEALDRYLRVLYGKNLRTGEQGDAYWIKRAGMSAAELAEAQKKNELAIGLYRRLMTELPPLRRRLEKKVEELSAPPGKPPGTF
jgi:TolA-binding protein